MTKYLMLNSINKNPEVAIIIEPAIPPNEPTTEIPPEEPCPTSLRFRMLYVSDFTHVPISVDQVSEQTTLTVAR
ncbi:MAG: hypothetical protein RDU14_01135 [Melioribacteraceae bacterium]|nr:hypothetical protein [Melioribacteraceae bacterium]